MEKFERIYEAHFTDVFAFLKYLTKDADEAEDLSQEVFLRFFKKYGALDDSDITNARALLLKVAKNLFLNNRRRKGKFVALGEMTFESLPDDSADFVSDHEWQEYVTEMTNRLKAQKKELAIVFVLRVVNGYNFGEIAKICGKTTRTIRRYMREIKEILKKYE